MYAPFSSYGNNVAVAASVASASGTLPGYDATRFSETVRVYNATASAAYFRFSPTVSPTAVATDTFIAPGSTEVFSLPPDTQYVAVILDSGTGNVYFQRGGGQ
jgi:hypothetical protein